jgi:SAM-dependent MidA family methyltransferase
VVIREEHGIYEGANPLEEKIKRLILDRGAMPFCRFMEMALYDPQGGYYETRADIIGASGDFITSPEVGPVFGRLIATHLTGLWTEAGCPSSMQVREYGAGQGRLCREALGFLQARRPDCYHALNYLLIERSTAMRLQLRQLMEQESFSERCYIVEADDFLARPDVPQVLIANELLDAFPVHWAVNRNGRLLEKWVDWDGGGFVAVEKEPCTDRLGSYRRWLGAPLEEGQEVIINLAAVEWMEKVSAMKSPLHLVIIDYGFLAEELQRRPDRSNSLACYHGQTVNFEPLRNAGCQDMTAHVDFSALMKRGSELGFSVKRFDTQLNFLLDLVSSSLNWFDWEADIELRLNLKELVHPERMGECFRVLELGRGRQ